MLKKGSEKNTPYLRVEDAAHGGLALKHRGHQLPRGAGGREVESVGVRLLKAGVPPSYDVDVRGLVNGKIRKPTNTRQK